MEIDKLVQQAMRNNEGRIIIGEVRDGEIKNLPENLSENL